LRNLAGSNQYNGFLPYSAIRNPISKFKK